VNRRHVFTLGAGALGGLAFPLHPAIAATDEVKVGMLRLPTALFVGIDQGLFAAEGIEVKPIFYRSGAELVPGLATGQIDVATTSPGAALFNAMAQGMSATIVADYWTSGKDTPSGDSAYIMVRKDLAPSGSLKSAKGLTVAVTARGQMTELFADAYLANMKLAPGDVKMVEMPLPDMNAALQNRAIDIASTIDPYATMLAQQGTAVKAGSLSALMPEYVQAVMMYGQRLAKTDRPLGMRFLRAFSRANLFLRAHLGSAAGRVAIGQIYQRYIPVDDPTLYQKIGLAVGPEQLTVDVDGKYALRWQMDQYVKSGLVPAAPNLTAFVDNSFAAAAAHGR
jgi:ABC-type nitrate/sulfonate/bicarbonate transport system substrate-binding protein